MSHGDMELETSNKSVNEQLSERAVREPYPLFLDVTHRFEYRSIRQVTMNYTSHDNDEKIFRKYIIEWTYRLFFF